MIDTPTRCTVYTKKVVAKCWPRKYSVLWNQLISWFRFNINRTAVSTYYLFFCLLLLFYIGIRIFSFDSITSLKTSRGQFGRLKLKVILVFVVCLFIIYNYIYISFACLRGNGFGYVTAILSDNNYFFSSLLLFVTNSVRKIENTYDGMRYCMRPVSSMWYYSVLV